MKCLFCSHYITLLSFFPIGGAYLFANVYPRVKLQAKFGGNAGDPLILTPYLKSGSIQLAQNLSLVPLTKKIGIESYAGFFTVDSQYNSNLYFWYFPAFTKQRDAPVLLWLQGGPGGSSLFGLFTELGPLIAKKDGFALRKYHWALNHHVIFIDNPVGTGFSFTSSKDGYCTNESCIGKGLYNALIQFFTLFPHLACNEFFISGESYAGKYIPVLALEIHQHNMNGGQDKINLQGLAIGNGFCDPVNQINYGSYLYQLGLIDQHECELFKELQKKIVEAIRAEKWAAANVLMDTLMDGEMGNFSYFKAFTGFNYYYNFLTTDDDTDTSVFIDLLENDNVRRSVHVGGVPFSSGETVMLNLSFDILRSVAPIISELLSHYRILFYNGQLDIVVAYPLTENFLRNLVFEGSKDYKTASRTIWRVDDDIAGYIKKAGNLTEALVRNAGHMVPHDQPKWAFDLITRFVRQNL